jgi:hypothetical protein
MDDRSATFLPRAVFTTRDELLRNEATAVHAFLAVIVQCENKREGGSDHRFLLRSSTGGFATKKVIPEKPHALLLRAGELRPISGI